MELLITLETQRVYPLASVKEVKRREKLAIEIHHRDVKEKISFQFNISQYNSLTSPTLFSTLKEYEMTPMRFSHRYGTPVIQALEN